MAKYVTFPGTSGNYVDTADTNLLPADEAHFEQSTGTFIQFSNAQNLALVTALTPHFGNTHLQWEATGVAAQTAIYSGTGTDETPVTAATEYTLSAYLACDTADWEARMRIGWLDAAGAIISYSDSGYTDLSTSAWTQVTLTATSPALTVYATPVLWFRPKVGNTAGGELAYADALCLQAGSDGTFTPSLRIVGDVDLRAKAGNDDWTNGFQCLLDAQDGTSGYYLAVDTAGELRTTHGTGADARINTSSGAALVDGSAYELRFTYDLASGTVTYYKDGTSFDTGSDTTTAAAAAGVALGVGSLNSGLAWFYAGDIYWCEVRDGVDGPVVARFDAEDVWDAI